MKIYTNGYALGGIGPEKAIELFDNIPLENGTVCLKPLTDDIDFKEWMCKDAEVKRFEKGVFIETEYIIPDEFLIALSLHTEGAMQFCWYDNMSGYSCTYFSKGEMLLERLTHFSGTLKNVDSSGEFVDKSTQELIRELFNLLTDASIEVGIKTEGESWYFTKRHV